MDGEQEKTINNGFMCFMLTKPQENGEETTDTRNDNVARRRMGDCSELMICVSWVIFGHLESTQP